MVTCNKYNAVLTARPLSAMHPNQVLLQQRYVIMSRYMNQCIWLCYWIVEIPLMIMLIFDVKRIKNLLQKFIILKILSLLNPLTTLMNTNPVVQIVATLIHEFKMQQKLKKEHFTFREIFSTFKVVILSLMSLLLTVIIKYAVLLRRKLVKRMLGQIQSCSRND